MLLITPSRCLQLGWKRTEFNIKLDGEAAGGEPNEVVLVLDGLWIHLHMCTQGSCVDARPARFRKSFVMNQGEVPLNDLL